MNPKYKYIYIKTTLLYYVLKQRCKILVGLSTRPGKFALDCLKGFIRPLGTRSLSLTNSIMMKENKFLNLNLYNELMQKFQEFSKNCSFI